MAQLYQNIFYKQYVVLRSGLPAETQRLPGYCTAWGAGKVAAVSQSSKTQEKCVPDK